MSGGQARVIVVVGASLAGLRAAETLRREGFDGRLVMLGDEPHRPYNRTPLSTSFLGSSAEGPAVPEFPTAGGLDAEWELGGAAVALDAGRREVVLASGRTVAYDGLVVATGARPRGLPGIPLPEAGVHPLRTFDQALALRGALEGARRVVVIGGGLIGTEVASACRERGLQVTVVSPDPPLVRVLGPLSPSVVPRMERHGVALVRSGVAAVTGRARPDTVVLTDGRRLLADVVVLAVGAVPETSWLDGSSVNTADGVLCDERLRVVGLTGAVAAGDVARWPHPLARGRTLRLEHWTNAGEQGAAAARALLHGDGAPAHAPVPSFWSDQFGIRLQGVGLPALAETVHVVSGDPSGDDGFLAEFHRAGELVGAVTVGRPKDLVSYRGRLAASFAAAGSR